MKNELILATVAITVLCSAAMFTYRSPPSNAAPTTHPTQIDGKPLDITYEAWLAAKQQPTQQRRESESGATSGANRRIAPYEVSFLEVYPACRNLNEALDIKLSFDLARNGQSVWQDYLLRGRLVRQYPGVYPPGFDAIQPSLEYDTRCLPVGHYNNGGGKFYPVIENPPKPDGVAEVPNGRVAICVIYGTRATREQPCSWVIAKPEDVMRRPSNY
jgi:hypothetical protein